MLDPRVRRTRRRLKEALFELIHEVGYRRLTVRELVARAGVARSTFYAHYDSKDDLLFDGFDAWLLGLAQGEVEAADQGTRAGEASGAPAGSRLPSGFRFSLPLLRHARGQRRIFRALFGRAGSPRAARRFRDLLVEVVLQEMHGGGSGYGEPGPATARRAAARGEDRSTAGARRTEARAHAVAGAFLALVGWWFEEGRRLTPEEVDGIFQGVVARRLREVARSPAVPRRSSSG